MPMALKPIKLTETPTAAPDGAAVIDAEYVVVSGGQAAQPAGALAKLKRAALRFALAILVAAALGALVPPLLIAAEMARR